MLQPRALSSFVAISSAQSTPPSAMRMARSLAVVGVGLVLAAFLPTHFKTLLGGLGALVFASLFVFLKSSKDAELESDLGDRHKLLVMLNRRRAMHGLGATIDQERLAVLELEAMRWELIETILSNRVWSSQPELAARIQESADELMTRIVLRYDARPEDEKVVALSHRLENLLRALIALDQAMFLYPREHDLTPNVQLPDSPELTDLMSTLYTC